MIALRGVEEHCGAWCTVGLPVTVAGRGQGVAVPVSRHRGYGWVSHATLLPPPPFPWMPAPGDGSSRSISPCGWHGRICLVVSALGPALTSTRTAEHPCRFLVPEGRHRPPPKSPLPQHPVFLTGTPGTPGTPHRSYVSASRSRPGQTHCPGQSLCRAVRWRASLDTSSSHATRRHGLAGPPGRRRNAGGKAAQPRQSRAAHKGVMPAPVGVLTRRR